MSGNEGFDRIAGSVDYPMYVVTAASDDDRAGCLVGFTTQCSIDPPRFLACLSKANHTYRVAQRSPVLAVHLLAHDDKGSAELFGAETGDEVDKFARCSWSPGPDGVPLLDDAIAWFGGHILDRLDLGDHVGFVLEPMPGVGGARDETAYYSFRQGRKLEPGHPA
ncbi:MAG TPA: flavin reductase family protein [Acidimicrobiales bacterium]|nr:flavin reductase family protein [Acidimicrobiales bacterium]